MCTESRWAGRLAHDEGLSGTEGACCSSQGEGASPEREGSRGGR
jgi:hypothetical protein